VVIFLVSFSQGQKQNKTIGGAQQMSSFWWLSNGMRGLWRGVPLAQTPRCSRVVGQRWYAGQEAAAATATTAALHLQLTDSCIQRLKEIQSEQQASEKTYLRISVEAGGCSGFSYHFEMGRKKDDDLVIAQDGTEVITDPVSWDFLKDSVVDYERKLLRSGFCIKANPNAATGCGCGVSFQPR
jgi:iron-sulfur cluster assembly accessory protein